jgi:hypothetical protein
VQIASNTSKHPGSKRHHQHHSKRVGALNAGFTGETGVRINTPQHPPALLQ